MSCSRAFQVGFFLLACLTYIAYLSIWRGLISGPEVYIVSSPKAGNQVDEQLQRNQQQQHQQNSNFSITGVHNDTGGTSSSSNSNSNGQLSQPRIVNEVAGNKTIEQQQRSSNSFSFSNTSTSTQEEGRVAVVPRLPVPVCSVNPEFEHAVARARERSAEVVEIKSLQQVLRLVYSLWKGNLFCDLMKKRVHASSTGRSNATLVIVTFSSRRVFDRSTSGTGNLVHCFYGLRMAARVFGNIDVVIEAQDALRQSDQLILPWLSGFFPESSQPAPPSVPRPDLDQACSSYDYSPIHYMLEDMRFDLRRMAIAFLGIPDPQHPAQLFAEKYLWSHSHQNHPHYNDTNDGNDRKTAKQVMQLSGPPLGFQPFHPNVHIDDVVLHFRCGDFMTLDNPILGFLKFYDYARFISPAARSIGIVTQPFAAGPQVRPHDRDAGERCRIVVHAFVEYLQQRHPQATVHIHNDPQETIALTYARLIMANQTIVGIGSFGVFPALACFGTGYIRKPDFDGVPNQFLLRQRLDMFTNTTFLFETATRLSSQRAIQMWREDTNGTLILDWFRNQEIP